MRSEKSLRFRSISPALPLYAFTVLFVLLPIIYAVFLSFMTRSTGLSVEYSFTLDNYRELFGPLYAETFLENFKLAVIVTGACIILGYPAGLALSRLDSRRQKIYMSLITFPFWINSVVRICGIIVIMRSELLLGKLDLLYSYPAVLITMIYALLPYMVYSVYSVAAKLDPFPAEAARTMGAGPVRVFLDVTLPLTAGGLLTGVTLTFIPCMGLIFISNLLGGGKMVLVGNLIEDQMLKVHNLPLAAALSIAMMILTGAVLLLCGLLDPVKRRRRRRA